MPKVKSDKAFPLFLIFTAAALVVLFAASNLRKPLKTDIVRYGSAEDKLTLDGYLIRNETLVNSPENGVLNCVVNENVRVSRYSKVASVFVGEGNDDLQLKLKNINERIRQIEAGASAERSLYAGDEAVAENAVYSRIDSLLAAVYKNDVSDTARSKEEINNMLRAVNGGEQSPQSDTLQQLKTEKQQLEQQLSTIVSDIYAPTAGVFSSVIDGYENYFSADKIRLITPEYLKNADANKVSVSQSIAKDVPAVKIADNYKWYTAVTTDSGWASTLKRGSTLKLRFPSVSDETVDAVVDYISPEENGKVALVVSCGEYVKNLFGLRKVEVDVIKTTYNGFKIPKEAVRVMPDGTTGVYILKETAAKFREINILYNGQSYVIAREDNSIKNNVLLYDEVIMDVADLSDGKIVK